MSDTNPNATIIVSRRSQFIGGTWMSIRVWIDNSEVAQVPNGESVNYKVFPGEHTIEFARRDTRWGPPVASRVHSISVTPGGVINVDARFRVDRASGMQWIDVRTR